MKRQVITGDFHALEAAFVGRVREIRKGDGFSPLLVLLPSGPLRLHLRRLLPVQGVNHINLRLRTLEELARAAAGPDLGARGLREIPDQAAELVLGEIARRVSEKQRGFYFSRIADRPGFHRALLATLRDLKDACLEPADLRKLAEKAAPKNQKLWDLAALWKAYDDYLADNRLFDLSDLVRLAGRIVPDSKWVARSPAVLVYGFYDFNEAQRRLLAAAFGDRDSLVFLPYERSRAFAFVEPTLDWLRGGGFEESDGGRAPLEPRNPVLSHLTRNLFNLSRDEKSRPAAGDPGTAVRILSAPGETREAREVVRCAVREALERGTPLHEIGILLRSAEGCGRVLGESFESAGLSPYVHEAAALSDTRPGRSVLLLLDVMESDFQRRKVMELASFAGLRPQAFAGEGEKPSTPEQWDMISMSAGIVSGFTDWTRRLEALQASLQRRQARETEDGEPRAAGADAESVSQLARFIRSLEDLRQKIGRAATWSDKAGALAAAFDTVIEPDDESGEVQAAIGRLSCLDDCGLPASLAGERFPAAVRDALDGQVLSSGRFQRHGPAVGSLMAMRGIPFRVVIVPGMVEKSFPPVIRQDAVLLDGERSLLNRALGPRTDAPIPLKAGRRLEEEKLLFRLAAGAALDRLVLTFPRLDIATGAERLPSSFLLAAVEALTGRAADFAGLEGYGGFSRIPLARPAPREPEQALDGVEFDLSAAQQALDAKRPDDILYLKALSPFFGRGLEAEKSRWKTRSFTAHDGIAASAEALKAARDFSLAGKGVSPTRLETYAACPFKYFLGHILGVEKLVEPERAQSIDPLDRGSLIHRVLYDFYEELGKERGVPFRLKGSDEKKLLSLAGRCLEDFEKTGVTGFPALWELESSGILEDLGVFFDLELEEEEFLPAYFELRFGMEESEEKDSAFSTREPAIIRAGKHALRLRGRIDRIDLSPGRNEARVVDYKSGRKYGKENDLEGGTRLQLPLYLLAAQQLLGKKNRNLKVARAEYYFMTDRGRFARVGFDAEALAAMQKRLERILATIVDGIDGGLFPAIPEDQTCRFCDFDLVCGSWKDALFERKRSDPGVSQVLSMRLEED
jgi:ATP-dependent helicase/nuclease subunit B